MIDMDFNIVEGGMDYDEFYEDFKLDFLNPKMTIDEIVEKYGISKNRYSTLRKRVCEETGLKGKPMKHFDGKSGRDYVQRRGKDKWVIVKKIGEKRVHFGMYDNFDTAVKIRNELMECGWDKTKFPEIRSKALLEEKLL